MDTNTIALVVIIVIVAGFFLWNIFRGKYIGEWIVHGAMGEKLYVYRTSKDAGNDGKETLQFHLRWEINNKGEKIDGNDCITVVPTHWITRMDRIIEK